VKGAHVALLIPEPDERTAAAVCDQMPFLVARAENVPAGVDPSDSIGDLVADLTEAVEAAPSIITIAPDVMSALQSESGSKRPYALLTLLRVAHVFTVLERGVVVTEAILLQARTIVEASESTLASLHKGQRALLRDEILEFVRAAGPEGLPHHKLVRRFRRRKNTSAADIKTALAALEREQKVIYELVETSGRYRGEWRRARV
jgi:hypothetical protein